MSQTKAQLLDGKSATIQYTAGSASAPAISFTSDTNTGIYSPGADQVAISTNGTKRIEIQADGDIDIDNGGVFYDATNNRLAIGTTPTDTLTVNGGIDIPANYTINLGSDQGGGATLNYNPNGNLDIAPRSGFSTVFLSTFGGSEHARIDSSGRLLVGTSSTSATLTALLQGNSSSATSNAGLLLARGEAPAADGTVLGALDYSANNHVLAARILCKRDGGTWTAGTSQPTRLEFSTTADGASSPTERMRITSAGELLIGSTSRSSASRIWIEGPLQSLFNGIGIRTTEAGTSYLNTYYNSAGSLIGSITTNGSSTAFNTSSDYRLKENLSAITDGISRLQQLKPSRFNFVADPAKTVDGFIAHEVQAVVPEAITGEKDAVNDDGSPIYQGIDQSKLVPLLTAALQEAVTKIESLEARLTAAGI